MFKIRFPSKKASLLFWYGIKLTDNMRKNDVSIKWWFFPPPLYGITLSFFLAFFNIFLKGTCHAKMGSIKDRNGMDLTEADNIKKRWQECTEELYKKDLHDPDNHEGVITHLEPYILECEVKWALGSITTNKASGGDGIPVELFQILKDDAVKVLHSMCQQVWKTQQWPQGWKMSVFIPVPKKGNAK